MFTWVCPKCGREVPPAYDECPACSGQLAGSNLPPEQPAVAPVPETPAPGSRPPASASLLPPAPPPQSHSTSPMFQNAPPPRTPAVHSAGTQVPTWLLALLIALVLVGIGGGVVWFVSYQRTAKPTTIAVVENPAAKSGSTQNPVQKFIEVTGLRWAKMSKGVTVTFILVNHSSMDLVGLAGNATVWGSTQKSEEDAVGTFAFETSMAAQTSKELTLPFSTKLKFTEIPNWQNVTIDLQITAPQMSSAPDGK